MSDGDPTLSALRSFYAHHIVANSGVPEVAARLIAAFEAVAREDFVGPGPWRVPTAAGYIHTPSANPVFLYQDILVALKGEDAPSLPPFPGAVHNGQPSLHALCLSQVNPLDGQTVVHVGAGTGYYTAILAALVGKKGRVIAYEIDSELADRAGRNLRNLSYVTVRQESGAQGPLPMANVIYVSAGATAPLAVWLDALLSGGRLVFPLTPAEGGGGMLMVTVQSGVEQMAATFISPAVFIACIGARDDETAGRLTQVFRQGGTERVKSLYRNNAVDDTCWFAGDGWWLSTRPVSSG